jgi:hypothetical protein
VKALNWPIQQPAFWQGGLFIVVCILICTLSTFLTNLILLKSNNKYKWIKHVPLVVTFAMGTLYLVSNGVILPFLFAYMYFGLLCYVGSGVLSFTLKGKNIKHDIISNLVCGICIWGSLAILLSLIGLGGFYELRIMSVILLLITIVFSFRRKYVSLLGSYCRLFNNCKHSSLKILCLIIITFICLSLATKTNVALDHDSMWYGLRPEYVLIGDNSFYDDLGLVSFVYNYPKLSELLLIPISNLGDYSFILCGMLMIFIFLLVTISYTAKRLDLFSDKILAIVLLTIATIPAIANNGITAKPDILGCLFCVIAWGAFLEFLRDKEVKRLALSVACLIMCTATKPTYVLWGGILFVTMVLVLTFLFCQKKCHIRLNGNKRYFIIVILASIVTVGVHLRTFFLTGYPFYPTGLTFFNMLGFNNKYGYFDSFTTNTASVTFSHIITRLHDLLFDPTKLSNFVMQWTTNSVLIIFLFWLIIALPKIRLRAIWDTPERLFKYLLCFFYCISSFYFFITMAQPDGNYFILPIIVIIIYLVSSIYNRTVFMKLFNEINRNLIKYALLIFLLPQIFLTFATHPSWTSGTIINPFEFRFDVTNFETIEESESVLVYWGLGEISQYIRNNAQNEQILSSPMNQAVLSRIPGRVIVAGDINQYFASKNIMDSYDGFKQFVITKKVKGFIIDKTQNTTFEQYCYMFLKDDECGEYTLLDSEKYRFYYF